MSRMDKRKEPDPEEQDLVEIMPLGAGQEVGRSCVIIKYMCAAACCLEVQASFAVSSERCLGSGAKLS